jgi:hypothetical protein
MKLPVILFIRLPVIYVAETKISVSIYRILESKLLTT